MGWQQWASLREGMLQRFLLCLRPLVHWDGATDTTFAQKGMTKCVHNWRQNYWKIWQNWRVVNVTLLNALDECVRQYQSVEVT
jgi:ribonuclease HI